MHDFESFAFAASILNEHGFNTFFSKASRFAWIASLRQGPYAAVLFRGERPKKPSGYATDPGDLGSGRYLSSSEATAQQYGSATRLAVSFEHAAFAGPAAGPIAYLLYGTVRGADRLAGADLMRADMLECGIEALVVDGYDSPAGHITAVSYASAPVRAIEGEPDPSCVPIL